MMTKSATALRWVVHRYFSAISVIVEIGMANFGSGGESSSLYFFSRREMGRSKVLHWQGPSWVRMSVQNKLLGDKPECSCNCLNLNFMSITILAFPHGNSKGEESVRDDVWHLDFARGILIEPAVCLPCFPVVVPLGSIH